MKYAKVFVTNITKDTNTDMGYGVWLHHVVCDCTVEGGKLEKQAYRIFSKKEYTDVMSKGYYEVEDHGAILKDIKSQIKETIEQYPNLHADNVIVSITNDQICFTCGKYLHKETIDEFLTAYVFDEKVDDDTALALNTANLLTEMNDIQRI